MNIPASKQLISDIRKASRELRNGRRPEALLLYDSVASKAADDIAVNIQLGHLCTELGAVEQAIAHYSIPVSKEPENAHYLSYLAIATHQSGQLDAAFDLYTRALAVNQEIADVHSGLGAIYMARSDYLQARPYLEKAQQLKPGEASVLTRLAITLMQLNEHEHALQLAKKAMKTKAADANTYYVVGQVLTVLGKTDEAIRHFEQTVRKHKTFGAAYDLLARVKKFSAADKPFIQKTEKILQQGMPPEQRLSVHYALGKMYDDCGEWDTAFEHYRQANLLKKRDYDIRREHRLLKKIMKAFDAATIARYRAFGHPSERPVFVIGMPRSGTTLIEQMISSHPQASGAGELPEIPRIAELVSPKEDLRRLVANTHANLTAANISGYAEGYLRILQQGRDGALRIVDKLPGNFIHLGLISILFPNATIVHARRHPLDTCLSCYFQNFTTVLWANDFEVIGHSYRSYRDLMSYWKHVLPAGKIIDVHYERLIENPETEGRRLMEACGLEWNSGILEFHQQKRAVKTASLWQVRQPIYRSSRYRWRNYAAHIGGLAGALSEYLQEDREALKDFGIDISRLSGRSWFAKLYG